MRGMNLLMLLGFGAALWGGPSAVVYGQAPPADATLVPKFTINVQDSPVRAALKQLFEAAHVQYSIDSRVSGFETLHITDQPFEAALKILMRSSSVPLAYTHEGGVYFIRVRVVDNIGIVREPEPEPQEKMAAKSYAANIITLNYADPYDLAPLLGIKIIPVGTRAEAARGTGGAPSTPAPAAGTKGSTGGVSGGTGSSGINAGNLISNDANNDILQISH